MKHSYTKPGDKMLVTLLLPNDTSKVGHVLLFFLKELMAKTLGGVEPHSSF